MRAAPSVPWGRRRRAEPCGWHARAGAGEMVRFCPPSIAPVLGWFLAVSRRPRVSCASLRVQHSMSVCRVRSVDRTTRRSHPFSWEFAPGGASPCIVMQYVRRITRHKSDPEPDQDRISRPRGMLCRQPSEEGATNRAGARVRRLREEPPLQQRRRHSERAGITFVPVRISIRNPRERTGRFPVRSRPNSFQFFLRTVKTSAI